MNDAANMQKFRDGYADRVRAEYAAKGETGADKESAIARIGAALSVADTFKAFGEITGEEMARLERRLWADFDRVFGAKD